MTAADSGFVSVLLGNGDGTFQDHRDSSTGSAGLRPTVGDFNGDGKLDVLVSNYLAGNVSVLLGNGDGSFQTPIVVPLCDPATDGQPSGTAAGDFNGDGKLDFAVAITDTAVGSGSVQNLVMVLLGNGDGSFHQSLPSYYVLNPVSVGVGDFNGDGKPDLAVTYGPDDSAASGNVGVLLGSGDGTFQGPTTYTVAGRSLGVAVGDMNGDGKQDLATANLYKDSVSVLLGSGDGTFQAAQDFATGQRPNAVAIGDFSHDDLPDLATGNSNTFSALLQVRTNQPPTADAGGPYALAEGGSLTLSASASSEPDGGPLTYSWDVNGDGVYGDATGVNPTLTWAQLQALGIDDGPSTWSVTVQASDGINPAVTSVATTLTLNNMAPTATLSNNGPVNEGSPVTVSFSSPSDPSTADTAAGFHYSYALSSADLAGSYAAATDGAGKPFTFDDSGSYTVYGRVIDKDGGYTDYATAVTVTNVAPTAGVSGPTDGSLNTAANFTLTASDLSTADSAAGSTYGITWGDGSTQTVKPTANNGGGLTVDHAYADVGIYPVSVTAQDKDAGTSTVATTRITVSGAQLITDPTDGTKTALVVGGTSGNDTIQLTKSKTDVKVSLNGTVLGTFSPTGYVIVYGQDGNDTISAPNSLTNPMIYYGGAGDDQLTGGGGPNILLGGDGNDTLTGRGDRDLLIGGDGADTLSGDGGDDMLIAGFTSYDAPTAVNQQALDAIMKEWKRTDVDYATRISHLQNGGGLNGSYLFNSSTAFDDAFVDSLTGGKGSDWFLLNLAGGSALDKSDKASNEVATDV